MGNLSTKVSYKDRVVWVVGASSGIGEAIAAQLVSEGAYVIISARSREKLISLQKHYNQNSVISNKDEGKLLERVKVLPFDVADTDNAEKNVSDAISLFGSIDVVVFASGISNRASVLDTDFEVQERLMRVNYFGPVALTKFLLEHFLQKSSEPGILLSKAETKSAHDIFRKQFVVLSSVQGKIGLPNRSAYSGSKHALHGFYDSLRAEVDQFGISVVICVLGYVNTNLSINALTNSIDKPHNTLDKTTANGYSKEYAAQRIVNAMKYGKEEVVIAQLSAVGGMILKRFFPSLLSMVLKRRGVKAYKEDLLAKLEGQTKAKDD